ncbi:unnamed protein product, partial [Didymodactylos carnosus]
VACYGYEGVDAVKAALKEGLDMSTEEKPVKINLIAPPLYVITSTCLDRKEGLDTLERVIECIKSGIEKYRGIFKVKMAPKVVTDVDDHALQKQMEDAERENEEVSGDDTDDEEGENEGGISGKLLSEVDVDEDEEGRNDTASGTTSKKTQQATTTAISLKKKSTVVDSDDADENED